MAIFLQHLSLIYLCLSFKLFFPVLTFSLCKLSLTLFQPTNLKRQFNRKLVLKKFIKEDHKKMVSTNSLLERESVYDIKTYQSILEGNLFFEGVILVWRWVKMGIPQLSQDRTGPGGEGGDVKLEAIYIMLWYDDEFLARDLCPYKFFWVIL